MTVENFLPTQYAQDNALPINHNYLEQQFADADVILQKIKAVVKKGDFTLGSTVDQFEESFRKITQTKHAIGVGSGTDALFLSLKALGVGPGDEVITTTFTFYATIGAIVTAGATPVFVDVGDDYNIDPNLIEEKITSKTKVILPVHWSGNPCQMDQINEIAKKHGLKVLEDACHAINASYYGRAAGSLGDIAGFSFHPLKNLNVWGDAGIIATNDDALADKLRLMRNHGLVGRDTCEVFAYNSRLDTVQAVVADHLLQKIDHITDSRIANSNALDKALAGVPQVMLPPRDRQVKQVYHLYSVLCEDRDALKAYLIEHGIDAKVHYPVPMHQQPAAKAFPSAKDTYKRAEYIANHTLSLPVHEFITPDDVAFMAQTIQEFYQ